MAWQVCGGSDTDHIVGAYQDSIHIYDAWADYWSTSEAKLWHPVRGSAVELIQ